ncbi:uncharacterized protein LOC106718288 [Papilio machaon]|uniref:uncharacterized protein LOC106718288 n=1 Tax=Papilio machaon TaxID=76193 RepID=UPI001E664CC7|nr:uncharacterized protein LOC106718288 [Papilio machaon]
MSTQVMEQPKGDSPKHPDMIMCGDHPSVTKTELNAREPRADKAKPKPPLSHSRITPSSSRTERPQPPGSELALRCAEGTPPRADMLPAANKALVYVALGSFRWPPYLLCVWVLVLLLTHALHALVAVLDAALPPLRKVCVYFRTWTEEAWRAGAGAEGEGRGRVTPLALGGATALLYAAYGALYAAHALALWAAEPLAAEPDDRPSLADFSKVTNYLDDGGSKTNFSLKH